MTWTKENHTIGGKISIATTIVGVAILVFGVVADLPRGNNVAQANTATTSVVVLNTAPTWDTNVYVQENPASASSSPTNAGSLVSWYASATDSSFDNYYLLICTNYASPTPNNGAAPTCAGGNANRVAVSAATQSGTPATAATTTYEVTPEINYYFSYICDGNSTGAACNAEAWSGTNSPAQSPFLVNHRPSFTLYTNDSPKNPGEVVTWYSTSSDPDTYGGTSQDRVRLFVCRAADFTGTACGAGGTWASSSYVTAHASATYTLSNPEPKGTFGAYGYIIDEHGLFAATGSQASTASVVVSNVMPQISSSSVSLLNATDTNPMILTTLAGQTTGFRIQYTVSDQNSCRTASSTDEIIYGLANVFRSSVGSTSCVTTGNYNPNFCYPGAIATTTWNLSCTASSTSCFGTSDSDVIWTCTFPLWYLADATDASSQFPSDNWLPTVLAADTSYATTSFEQAQTGTELLQFLGYDISTTTIAYGGLQPGNSADLTSSTSVGLIAQGNVGLDESLYGDDMCPTYPSCTGNATSTIFVANQKYSSTTVTYAAATSTLSAVPTTFALRIPKSTSTSSPETRTTYWGILVPGTITLSGSYIGRNTILGITSPSSSW